jgi:hypothetical protein
MIGEGPKAIFDGAVAWLRGRLLPAGVTTLERMVATGREAAEQRLWRQLTTGLSTSARNCCTNTDGPVYLVVDGHPTHKGKDHHEVRRLHQRPAQTVRTARLLPATQPRRWVWKNVKHDRIGRTSACNADEFRAKITAALRRLQNMPHLVRAFFNDPDLRYITA